MQFKIGDKVEATKEIDGEVRKGSKGKVLHVEDGRVSLGVEWEKKCLTGGHELNNGKAKKGHGWYVHPSAIKLIKSGPVRPTKFLLQYELDEDPVEEFATMEEAQARAKELFETNDDLKKDSVVIWEVAKKYTVKGAFALELTETK